jgi:ribonuclease Z
MDQIRIVFLGTGAAAPTRDRNVSSLAVVLDGRVLLFDCGEGTQHQLARGPVRSGAIEAIFITHLHGDHLFGLPGLIATLGLNARSEPLTIYGPPGLARYLESIPYPGATYPIEVVEIFTDENAGANRETVAPLPPGEGGRAPGAWPGEVRESRAVLVTPLPAGEGGRALARPGEGRESRGNAREFRRAPGYRVYAAALHHSVPCLGYAIVEDDRPGVFDVTRARDLGVPEGPLFGRLQRGHDVVVDGRTIRSKDIVGRPRQGRRIVFCTDTRPCDAAIDLARGADLFVHEATYANDHAQEAVDRYHSTAAEAAQVAAAAQPRRLVLTHVSARYETDAPLLAEALPIFPNTEVASDFLVVPVLPAAE